MTESKDSIKIFKTLFNRWGATINGADYIYGYYGFTGFFYFLAFKRCRTRLIKRIRSVENIPTGVLEAASEELKDINRVKKNRETRRESALLEAKNILKNK